MCNAISSGLANALPGSWAGMTACEQDGDSGMSLVKFAVQYHNLDGAINAELGALFPPDQINGEYSSFPSTS
jgi:hypothetical protein